MVIQTFEKRLRKKKVNKLVSAIIDAACHQSDHPFDFEENNSFKLFQSYYQSDNKENAQDAKVIPIDSLGPRKPKL